MVLSHPDRHMVGFLLIHALALTFPLWHLPTMKAQKTTKHPPVVPEAYRGQWIAWNHNRTRIIASGVNATTARRQAQSAGEAKPVLAKVPRGRFIGRAA